MGAAGSAKLLVPGPWTRGGGNSRVERAGSADYQGPVERARTAAEERGLWCRRQRSEGSVASAAYDELDIKLR